MSGTGLSRLFVTFQLDALVSNRLVGLAVLEPELLVETSALNLHRFIAAKMRPAELNLNPWKWRKLFQK